MGLNNSYSQARSQNLMMSPTPLVNQAYSMVISDESQRNATTNAGILDSNPVNAAGNFEGAMYSRTNGFQGATGNEDPRNGGNPRFKRNYNLYCEVCKLKGHSKENCFKVVGYPSDYRFKKGGNAGHGYSAAYNVYVDDNSHGRNEFLYGQNTNVPVMGGNMSQVPQNNGQIITYNQQNLGMVGTDQVNQTCGALFTKSQYEQIIKMLGTHTQMGQELKMHLSMQQVFKLQLQILQMQKIKDLFTGRVKEIGKEVVGLYLLLDQNGVQRNIALSVQTVGDDYKINISL
ncbi:uncharacterized protein LOC132618119 [Lycium barbarum]|uniref:uncharacterized protein LOC132618119 n=1 Tax=Lycium barbarum TaxID=112863 RepID=UPI00293E3675|nr:uncharacterized protein LOC132618119 [Lycium barbarum]